MRLNAVLLIFCSSVIYGCGGNNNTKTPSITNKQEENRINFVNIKAKYALTDELNIQIEALEGVPIDSVQYSINDKPLSTGLVHDIIQYSLKNEKFGKQVLKAKVYRKSEIEDVAVDFDILPAEAPSKLSYQVINIYPHDIKAFTQGLEFYKDNLVESTGNGTTVSDKHGISSVQIVNPKTGEVLKIAELDETIFGEGATVLNNKIYQLTYKNNEAYVYDVNTLKRIGRFPYFQNMEGWGLTNDGTNLYMTDGSEKIYTIDPSNFNRSNEINVASDEGLVTGTNEMEWVKGKIYANFFMTNMVGIIEPKTDTIEAVLDLSELRQKVTQHIDLDVLNGIAYNKKSDTFFITGKNWDKIFEIKIVNEIL